MLRTSRITEENALVEVFYAPEVLFSWIRTPPRTPYKILKSLLLEASPKFEEMIQGNKMRFYQERREVHTFLLWVLYRVLLNPEPTLDAGPDLVIDFPPNFLYDTLSDSDLMCMYFYGCEYEIRSLRNDVMTQLILQHSLDGTLVDSDCIFNVASASRLKNSHFIKFAIADMARLSWDNPAILPDDPEDAYESDDRMFLIAMERMSAQNARFVARGGVPYMPAENVCDFHEHIEGEHRECREKQRRLGLPVLVDDDEEEEEDSEEE